MGEGFISRQWSFPWPFSYRPLPEEALTYYGLEERKPSLGIVAQLGSSSLQPDVYQVKESMHSLA